VDCFFPFTDSFSPLEFVIGIRLASESIVSVYLRDVGGYSIFSAAGDVCAAGVRMEADVPHHPDISIYLMHKVFTRLSREYMRIFPPVMKNGRIS
jgi:hypothetical protein